MVILSDPNKQELASFISDVLWSLCLFLFLKTNPDFETIYAVPNRVSNVATSAFKSIMENGQSPKDEPAVFRGTISSSPTDSDKLSPVSTPRGKKIMILSTLGVNLLMLTTYTVEFPSLQVLSHQEIYQAPLFEPLPDVHVIFLNGEETHHFQFLCDWLSASQESRRTSTTI